MTLLQIKYALNVWLVLVVGVLGSALGRYTLSLYIPWLSIKMIKPQKNRDLQFIGQKLAGKGWQIQFFVLLYTLLPLPSTPLFTAAGVARIRAINIIPAFLVGKFTSDMVMVFTGEYLAKNAQQVSSGFITWKSITGTAIGVLIISIFLFIDWRILIQEKKFRLNFRIWN
jgi:membrane protein YqaA with SNARE-associated domain